MTPPISMEAGGPASRLSVSQQNREGGITSFRKSGFAALLLSVTALGGCAHKFIPPDINYDTAVPAKLSQQTGSKPVQGTPAANVDPQEHGPVAWSGPLPAPSTH